MLVLLGISSVIAVIIPNPRRDAREQEERESATGASGATGADVATGGSGTTGTTDEGGKPGGAGNAPGTETAAPAGSALRVTLKPDGSVRTIAAEPDSRLILTVESGKPVQVLIPDLGRTGFADRWAPAYLDLILPGDYGSIPVLTAPPGERGGIRRAVIQVGEKHAGTRSQDGRDTAGRSGRGSDRAR